MKRTLPYYAIAAFSMTATTAHATDASLYAEAPPEDASFVRFAGFGGAESAEFAGKTFTLNPDEKLAYAPVSAAALTGIEPGAYFTVVQKGRSDSQSLFHTQRKGLEFTVSSFVKVDLF